MTTDQAIAQADLWIFYTRDDTHPHHARKAEMSTTGWTPETLSESPTTKWTHPTHDGWAIYQHPDDVYYVWNRFTFAGEDPTLEAAVQRVESRRAALVGGESW